MGSLKVFTCNDHAGFWPVGSASVVVAENETEAREILRGALIGHGLKDEPFTLKELDINRPHAVILNDGDY